VDESPPSHRAKVKSHGGGRGAKGEREQKGGNDRPKRTPKWRGHRHGVVVRVERVERAERERERERKRWDRSSGTTHDAPRVCDSVTLLNCKRLSGSHAPATDRSSSESSSESRCWETREPFPERPRGASASSGWNFSRFARRGRDDVASIKGRGSHRETGLKCLMIERCSFLKAPGITNRHRFCKVDDGASLEDDSDDDTGSTRLCAGIINFSVFRRKVDLD